MRIAYASRPAPPPARAPHLERPLTSSCPTSWKMCSSVSSEREASAAPLMRVDLLHIREGTEQATSLAVRCRHRSTGVQVAGQGGFSLAPAAAGAPAAFARCSSSAGPVSLPALQWARSDACQGSSKPVRHPFKCTGSLTLRPLLPCDFLERVRRSRAERTAIGIRGSYH